MFESSSWNGRLVKQISTVQYSSSWKGEGPLNGLSGCFWSLRYEWSKLRSVQHSSSLGQLPSCYGSLGGRSFHLLSVQHSKVGTFSLYLGHGLTQIRNHKKTIDIYQGPFPVDWALRILLLIPYLPRRLILPQNNNVGLVRQLLRSR